MTENTRRCFSGFNGLLCIAMTVVIQPLAVKILWQLYNRNNPMFSIPLHYRSTENLLIFKEKLELNYQSEVKKTNDDNIYSGLLKLTQFFLLMGPLIYMFSTPQQINPGNFWLRLPLLALIIIFAFKLSNFNFNFIFTEEKQRVAQKLKKLQNTLSITRELREILSIKSVNLGKIPSSYLLLTTRPLLILPVNTTMAILQQALSNAQITFYAEGQEVAIFSNTSISDHQQKRFNTAFLRLYHNGFVLQQLNKQLYKLGRILRQVKPIDYTRVEEGFLTHSELESRLYIHSHISTVRQTIAKWLMETGLSIKTEENQIVITHRQCLTEAELNTLSQKIISGFSSLQTQEQKPPLPALRKGEKSHAKKYAFMEVETQLDPAPIPRQLLSPMNPHLQPVQGSVKRYILFNLPLECFDNDQKLRERFKSKSTQMAKSEKDSQGIKHSTYIGCNFFTGKLQSFPANIKLCGANSNHRVLLTTHIEKTSHIMVYTACAFERNVH